MQQRHMRLGLASGLAGALVAGLLQVGGYLDRWEASTWDSRVVQSFQEGRQTDDIRIVLLDQGSLDWVRDNHQLSWPWMRQSYAHMLAFFQRAQPKALVFDWLFTDPSSFGSADDASFVAAIEDTPGFVGTVMTSEHGQTYWPQSARARLLEPSGLETWSKLPVGRATQRSHVGFPIEGIRDAATGLGDVGYQQDHGSVVRRVAPFVGFDGGLLPSLGLAALVAGEPPGALELNGRHLSLDKRRIPLDTQGRVILRYRGESQTHDTVSAAAVIQSEIQLQAGQEPRISPEHFRGKYVFFGPSAPGLGDLKATPAGVSPGVEVHATFLDNLLSGDLLEDTPTWLDAFYTLLLALGTGLLAVNASRLGQSLLLFVTASALPYAAGLLAYKGGFWLPVVGPTVAGVSALLLGLGLGYAMEGRQRQFIKSAFKQYLSPHVIDRLIANPDSLKLGGELRELTIFFSDVKGFSTISESLSPEALTGLLNEYLSEMCEIIMEEGGTIDKYEGDAVIAFWNAPVDLPDHAVRGVRAALRCQRRLAELRPRFQEAVGHEIHARIGLNTGPVVVGNMGSRQRFDYTFLGDAGNLAARLEGANKAFDSWSMISEDTKELAGDGFCYRELGRITVVGRAQHLAVYEPFLPEDHAPRRADLERFGEALKLFQAGEFQQAQPLFEALAGGDPTAANYLSRCEALLENPPVSWDGILHLDTK